MSHAKDVELKEEDKKEVLNIIESCPVGAIVVEEETENN